MGDDIGSGPFALIFTIVQLSAAEYVLYGHQTTVGDSLSLNQNRCHRPLITQLIMYTT